LAEPATSREEMRMFFEILTIVTVVVERRRRKKRAWQVESSEG
jgi:hypothetical protein